VGQADTNKASQPEGWLACGLTKEEDYTDVKSGYAY